MLMEIIKMAFESLLSNKTRTFLSMLGIIIGVSTVIAVFAIGQGAQNAVNQQFQGLSANSIIVMQNRGRGVTGKSKLVAGDAAIIKSQAQYISNAIAVVEGRTSVAVNSVSQSTTAMGVEPDYFAMSSLLLDQGRLFTSDDSSTNGQVAVLGSGAVATFFPDATNVATVIGQTMKIGGKDFQVVGTTKATGRSMGPSRVDDSIFIPQTTAEKSVLGSTGGEVMIFTLADKVDDVTLASDELTSILRNAHKLKSTQADDFRLMDAGSMVSAAQSSASLMKFVLMAVAAIVLLVSGIGIMNVMFVTVAERTKEIGIAKAIGGKREDILTQFLLESVILSTIGGVVGVAAGSGVIPLISMTGQLTVAFSWLGPIIGFCFSVMVGVFFGFYPAYKASRLDPVDALRSE